MARQVRVLPLLALVAMLGFAVQVAAQDSLSLPMPAEGRAALAMPDAQWAELLGEIGFVDRPLGYTDEEMRNFPADPHRFPIVDRLFRDALNLPRVSGRIAQRLADSHATPRQAVELGFALMSIAGARGVEPPTGEDWGVDWLPAGTSPLLALDYLLQQGFPAGQQGRITTANVLAWARLPEGVQRLVVRLWLAAWVARPWLQSVLDRETVCDMAGVDTDTPLTDPAFYTLLSAPWQDTDGPVPAGFALLDAVDLQYLAVASILYVTHVQAAIHEFAGWASENGDALQEYRGCRFHTSHGSVAILGTGEPAYQGADSLVIGSVTDTAYTGPLATPHAWDAPISLCVDFGGNDTYACDTPGGLACGRLGIGALIDISGDDTYRNRESGLGCAWYGTGFLWDFRGDDTYETTDAWGQGAAHAGLGLLLDTAGDDRYLMQRESQGMGATLGVGLLVDTAGNDIYHARDDENGRAIVNPSPQSAAHEATMGQGAGYGRRADFGDAHSLAGGIGGLVDGAGDDTYYGGVFSQGVGYWWGFGFLEDLGGNDSYRGVWYAQAASAHFGLASCVDLAGDDRYNDDAVMSQTLGNGRDGSIAVFYEGAGNDTYRVHNRSAGQGDLNGIGLFWDRLGNDTYELATHREILGAASVEWREPQGNFRDRLATVGLFIDSDGTDAYERLDGVRAWQPFPADASRWQVDAGPVLWGVGVDAQWYERLAPEPPPLADLPLAEQLAAQAEVFADARAQLDAIRMSIRAMQLAQASAHLTALQETLATDLAATPALQEQARFWLARWQSRVAQAEAAWPLWVAAMAEALPRISLPAGVTLPVRERQRHLFLTSVLAVNQQTVTLRITWIAAGAVPRGVPYQQEREVPWTVLSPRDWLMLLTEDAIPVDRVGVAPRLALLQLLLLTGDVPTLNALILQADRWAQDPELQSAHGELLRTITRECLLACLAATPADQMPNQREAWQTRLQADFADSLTAFASPVRAALGLPVWEPSDDEE